MSSHIREIHSNPTDLYPVRNNFGLDSDQNFLIDHITKNIRIRHIFKVIQTISDPNRIRSFLWIKIGHKNGK